MTNQSVPLHRVFHALADPTRLAVLERLTDGPAPVTDLAAPFAMALPSFLQHLKVLEDGGWIRSEKHGRVRTCRITDEGLRSAGAWIERHRAAWDGRADRLDALLRTLKHTEADHDK